MAEAKLNICGKDYLLKLNVAKIKSIVMEKFSHFYSPQYPHIEFPEILFSSEEIFKEKSHQTSVIHKNYKISVLKLLRAPSSCYVERPANSYSNSKGQLLGNYCLLCDPTIASIYPKGFIKNLVCDNAALECFRAFVIEVICHELGHSLDIDLPRLLFSRQIEQIEKNACDIGLELLQGNAESWLSAVEITELESSDLKPATKLTKFYIPAAFIPKSS